MPGGGEHATGHGARQTVVACAAGVDGINLIGAVGNGISGTGLCATGRVGLKRCFGNDAVA